jgi:diguanylate cyclase (GGDEF)-like protein
MPKKNPEIRDSWGHLSTAPAGRREWRYALGILLVSTLVFVLALPFSRTPLAQLPAFVPVYVTALVLCDLITAVLLLGQFRALRSPALLVLAGGYLFTATITAAYALIFPGLFAARWLFGAGPQTSSAMFMGWHTGFPLAVIAYARLKRRDRVLGGKARRPIHAMVVVVLALVVAWTTFATAGHALLPVFLDGNRTTDIGHATLLAIWLLSLGALLTLWRGRPHVVLDVWLMVVMCVWLFDLALAAVLNTGRYDLGWYAGRAYGLLSAGFLLVLLLSENAGQYARLVRLSSELAAVNDKLLQLSLHDGLTELANRRRFDEFLAEQLAVSARHRLPLALLLIDVDHFKAYNDHYGHPAGDECLKRVAAALSGCCRRPADLAARYGGEEFALILPDTNQAGAAKLAEAARAAVEGLGIEHARSSAGPRLSVSIGVAALAVMSEPSAKQLIAAADEALYRAKDLGRNQVSCGLSENPAAPVSLAG